MSPNPSTYRPNYVDVDDIPVVGPDEGYDVVDKRKALFKAEMQLELDLNRGEQFEEQYVTNSHVQAVLELGTYELTKRASGVNDITLADMANGGNQAREYAQQFLDEYRRLIEQIRNTSLEGTNGTGSEDAVYGGTSVASNTGERNGSIYSNRRPYE